MRVLMLSTDKSIFEEGSDARRRMIEYTGLFDELHIIVFSKQNVKQQLVKNCFAYSTNSFSRFFYIFDAVRAASPLFGMFGGETSKHSKQWVITAQDPFETGLAGFILARKFGAPLQLQVHTDFLSPHFARGFLNTIRVRIAKFLLPRAQCVRAVSKRIAGSLSVRSAVVPIFVDTAAIRVAPVTLDLHKKYPRFDFIVLMASRLTEEKDIGTALRATQQIVRARKNTGFVIAGDGPLRARLIREAERLGITENVVFLGAQGGATLASCYKTADAYLLTSLYEGYGRTLIEAAAAECPVVTTDVGIAGDILRGGDSALVCPVGDAECIALRIEELMTNAATRHALALKARESIEKRTMPRETYLRSYKEILEACTSSDNNT